MDIKLGAMERVVSNFVSCGIQISMIQHVYNKIKRVPQTAKILSYNYFNIAHKRFKIL